MTTEHADLLVIGAGPAGLEAARARGRNGGRPSKLSDNDMKRARQLYAEQRLTVAEIGLKLGVSRTTIYRVLNGTP